MIIYEYASEKHLVDSFIMFTHNNKIELSPNKYVHLFIWGHEIWLPEGGKAGYNGSIDLIGTDELGNVWLIEAKQSANPELNPKIWRNQVLNYRWGISRRSQDEISIKSRRYLLRQGSSNTVPSFISSNCTSLFDAFCDWLNYLGKDNEEAIKLYNVTLEKIEKEQVISVVLADVLREDIVKSAPRDEKDYAYIVIQGTEKDCHVNVVTNFSKLLENKSNTDHYKSVKNWKELTREKQKVKPTPETVELYLSNGVV